jgi:hypothetical protein
MIKKTNEVDEHRNQINHHIDEIHKRLDVLRGDDWEVKAVIDIVIERKVHEVFHLGGTDRPSTTGGLKPIGDVLDEFTEKLGWDK